MFFSSWAKPCKSNLAPWKAGDFSEMCKSLFYVFLEHCKDGLGLWSTAPPSPPPIKSRVSDNKQFSYRKLPHSLIVMGFQGISRKYSIWVLVSSARSCCMWECKKKLLCPTPQCHNGHFKTQGHSISATKSHSHKSCNKETNNPELPRKTSLLILRKNYLWSITIRNKELLSPRKM